MTYYALRHKPTGDLFPSIIGRGQTFIEFEAPDKKAPRLWTKEKDAKCFLTLWCKGPLCAEYDEVDEDGFGLKSSVFKGWKGDPSMAKTSRTRDEYEVVPATLILSTEVSK